MRTFVAVAMVAMVALTGCGSGGNNSQQIRDLQATVAALAARTPQVITVTHTPTQLPDIATPGTATPVPEPQRPSATPAMPMFHLTGLVSSPQFCGPGEGLILDSGMPVIVKNEANIIVANSITVDKVVIAPVVNKVLGPPFIDHGCTVAFDVSVPQAQFYQVSVGRYQVPTYSFDQMQQMGWHLELEVK